MRQDPSIGTHSDNELPREEDIQSSRSELNEHALQDYRQRYGLSLDPFGKDPYFPFFTGGHRHELLEQVVHLCQFGQGLPIIVGARGVGKTRLALALYQSFGGDNTCFIGALPTVGPDALLQQIAQHFAVGGPQDSADQLIVKLRDLGQPVDSAYDLALVVIDDAHDLNDDALAALLPLMQQHSGGSARHGLQIVLVGDEPLTARLGGMDESGVAVTAIYVERLTLAETVDYLNFRMEMADYLGPEMFDEVNVDPWWSQSQGQLHQIHRYAQAHLLDTVLPPLATSGRPFPVLHLVAVAVLGSAVIMTLLYSSGSQDQAAEPQRTPISLQAPPHAVPSTVPIVMPEPPSVAEESEVVMGSVDEQVEVIDNQDAISAAPADVLPSPVVSAPDVAPPAREPVQAQTPARVSEPPAASKLPQTSKSFTQDEEVLLSWNASDYTLQLLGVSTEKAARDFIAAQPNRADLLMFRTTRQGKDWFVVVAGRYSDASAAKNGIAGLPSEQIKAGPWARALTIIQQEIQR